MPIPQSSGRLGVLGVYSNITSAWTSSLPMAPACQKHELIDFCHHQAVGCRLLFESFLLSLQLHSHTGECTGGDGLCTSLILESMAVRSFFVSTMSAMSWLMATTSSFSAAIWSEIPCSCSPTVGNTPRFSRMLLRFAWMLVTDEASNAGDWSVRFVCLLLLILLQCPRLLLS